MHNVLPGLRTSAPSDDEELRINGINIVLYDLFAFPEPRANFLQTRYADPIRTPYHYDILFDFSEKERAEHAVFQVHAPLVIPPILLPTAGTVSGEARLMLQVVNEQFVLATTVLNVDRRGLIFHGPHLSCELPLRTDDVLVLINQLNRPESSVHSDLAEQRRLLLDQALGAAPVPMPALKSRYVAIEIWDIDNYADQGNTVVNGLTLATQYAWEVTALLLCNSDLWQTRSAWKARRLDQVLPLLQTGTDVVADHRVITIRSVCLEITQVVSLPLTPRSTQRSEHFGYDSTSIYLWSYLILADFIITYFNSQLSRLLELAKEVVVPLIIRDKSSSFENSTIRSLAVRVVEAKVSVFRALDIVWWLPNSMNEQRHTKFFVESAAAQGTDSDLVELERKMEELTSIVTDVNQSVVALDQRDIMEDLRQLNRSSSQTRRSLEFLNFIVAATAVSAFSSVLGSIFPSLGTPVMKAVVSLSLFLLVVLVYLAITRSAERGH